MDRRGISGVEMEDRRTPDNPLPRGASMAQAEAEERVEVRSRLMRRAKAGDREALKVLAAAVQDHSEFGALIWHAS